MDRLVVASANPDKVRELRELLSVALPDCVLVPRPSHLADVDEDADTLEGNALLKARAIADATGNASVADDTGLFVDALGGLPGVRTARYAGPGATPASNRAKLLAALFELGATDPVRRGAEFRTVMAVVRSDATTVIAAGSVSGRITDIERGDAGFGYDSLFIPSEGDGRTFAEMTEAEKHALSHRGRAIAALVAKLSIE